MYEGTEDNRLILRDWIIGFLPTMTKDGDFIVPSPAPLNSEQIRSALEEVAAHPAYASQTISVPDHLGERTIMRRLSDDAMTFDTLPPSED